MIENYPKRLIEVDLPIKRISAHARREKSIRHGHISTLHIWWARRPLAACRAVICASLWFDPADDLCPKEFREIVKRAMLEFAENNIGELSDTSYHNFNRIAKNPKELNDNLVLRGLLLDFIADFANWDNSTNESFLETARFLTHTAHLCLTQDAEFLEAFAADQSIKNLKSKIQNLPKPLVVDPFAGGGTIPLEALRVGADAFASDLNPVAVLLNKVVLEYIPRYGERLAKEVKKWGAWIKEEAEKELAEFYPKDSDGATPIAYLWARTVICEGPACGAEIPLMRSLWLAKKVGRSVGLQFVIDKTNKHIDFEIIKLENRKWISETTDEEITNPKFDGTAKRGNATCPVCEFTTKVASVRRQLKERRGGTNDARLFCIVTAQENQQGRVFRLPQESDLEAVRKAQNEIKKRIAEHRGVLSLVPDEKLDLRGIRHTWAMIYGMDNWGDFFTQRQLLSITTIVRLINEISKKIKTEDVGLSKAVLTVLSFALNRGTDYWSSLALWAGDFVAHTFGRQALPFIIDFAEVAPFCDGSGNWDGAVGWTIRVIEREASARMLPGEAINSSASEHPLPDEVCNLWITDPPYYDAIAYSYLSDFFYVWLKRSLADNQSDLLKYETVPKDNEIIVDRKHELSNSTKDLVFYEKELSKAFSHGQRIISKLGVGVVVFASKSTASWEAVLHSIVNSGWIITGSWAIDTERESRVSGIAQARLQSSIHIVCRPREKGKNIVGEWSKVLQELPRRIHEWMPRLRDEGIVGADAIFACLGPALEIFSRYERVEKSSGEVVPLRDYLESVWAAVSKEALQMIFADADASGFEPDARLTAMWLWTLSTAQGNTDLESRVINALNPNEEADDDEEESTGKAKTTGFSLEFDTARKIAQGMGINLEELRGTVEVKGELARLLAVKERSNVLFGTTNETTDAKTATRKKNPQPNLFAEAEETVETGVGGWNFADESRKGETVLDRLHQAMLFFAANRSEALKRFLVEDGVGQDERFWRLANALSALYPTSSEEKRWVDGILARKKGLGF